MGFKKALKYLKNNIGFDLHNDLKEAHIFEEVASLMNYYSKEQLILHGVIIWVMVKDQKPVENQQVLIYHKKYGISLCGYLSPHWEWIKPTHWADTKHIKLP